MIHFGLVLSFARVHCSCLVVPAHAFALVSRSALSVCVGTASQYMLLHAVDAVAEASQTESLQSKLQLTSNQLAKVLS